MEERFMSHLLMKKAIDRFLKEDLESARMMFEMALLEEPFNLTAKLGIVCIDAVQDGFSEALNIFKLAMFATEEEKEKIYSSLIEGSLEEVSSYDEWYVDSEFLALSYIKAGEVDMAKAELESAVYLDPQSAEKHYLLGEIYEKLGNIERAMNHYEKSLSINPLQKKIRDKFLNLIRKDEKRRNS
jgi:tetratricopeptide (TPR) repeat protein